MKAVRSRREDPCAEHGKKRPGRTGTEMTVTVEYEAKKNWIFRTKRSSKNVIEESLDYVECPYDAEVNVS